MLIEITGNRPLAADAAAEECLVHLARCGVLAVRLPGTTRIQLPECAGPSLRVDLDAPESANGPIAALLLRLVETGAIPAIALQDEELLMTRLTDLGYL